MDCFSVYNNEERDWIVMVCGLLRRFTPSNDEGAKGSIRKLVIARA